MGIGLQEVVTEEFDLIHEMRAAEGMGNDTSILLWSLFDLACKRHLGDPATELIWVANGGRHAHQWDAARTADDDFLPHTTPIDIP